EWRALCRVVRVGHYPSDFSRAEVTFSVPLGIVSFCFHKHTGPVSVPARVIPRVSLRRDLRNEVLTSHERVHLVRRYGGFTCRCEKYESVEKCSFDGQLLFHCLNELGVGLNGTVGTYFCSDFNLPIKLFSAIKERVFQVSRFTE